MILQCEEGPFSRSVLVFLGQYTQNGSYLISDKQHFEFELARLGFNSWGALKKVTTEQRRMLLTFWVIIHVMLPLVFSRPWEIDSSKYPYTTTLMLNIRFCGSILYHIFMDNFRSLPKLPNNQGHLGSGPSGLGNRPRKDSYKFGRPY